MTTAELEQKRRNQDVTQVQLAARLGWKRETLIDVGRGRIELSERSLSELEAAIDDLTQEKLSRREVSVAA